MISMKTVSVIWTTCSMNRKETDADEKKKQEFAEDEFMLDNPEDK